MAKIYESVVRPAHGGFGMYELGEAVLTECSTVAEWNRNAMKTNITWRELIVTDSELGYSKTLGAMVDDPCAHAQLIDLEVELDGSVRVWGNQFISAPSEEPSWCTPNPEEYDIDWNGFADAFNNAVARIKESQ